MNKLNIKIAFFDIDGTLTNSKKEITKETIETLNKLNDKGIEIVICSGRGNSYLINLLKDINYSYIISSNGAEIYDNKKNNVIYSNKLNFNTLKNVYNFAIKNGAKIELNGTKNRHVNYDTRIKTDAIFIKDISILKNIDLFQIIIINSDYITLQNIEEYVNNYDEIYIINYSKDYLNKMNNGALWFDIVNKNVNKGIAITNLLNRLNIDKRNAICFGDAINDIDMFNACGIKIAMDNALDTIKEKADYITDSNDNEGITNFFNKYFFK